MKFLITLLLFLCLPTHAFACLGINSKDNLDDDLLKRADIIFIGTVIEGMTLRVDIPVKGIEKGGSYTRAHEECLFSTPGQTWLIIHTPLPPCPLPEIETITPSNLDNKVTVQEDGKLYDMDTGQLITNEKEIKEDKNIDKVLKSVECHNRAADHGYFLRYPTGELVKNKLLLEQVKQKLGINLLPTAK